MRTILLAQIWSHLTDLEGEKKKLLSVSNDLISSEDA